MNHHHRFVTRVATGDQIGDEAVLQREIVLRDAGPSEPRRLNEPEDVERAQIHRSREDSEKDGGERTGDIDPGVAANLRSQILRADVGLGRLTRSFSFD